MENDPNGFLEAMRPWVTPLVTLLGGIAVGVATVWRVLTKNFVKRTEVDNLIDKHEIAKQKDLKNLCESIQKGVREEIQKHEKREEPKLRYLEEAYAESKKKDSELETRLALLPDKDDYHIMQSSILGLTQAVGELTGEMRNVQGRYKRE